eukprot:UN15637
MQNTTFLNTALMLMQQHKMNEKIYNIKSIKYSAERKRITLGKPSKGRHGDPPRGMMSSFPYHSKNDNIVCFVGT